MWFKVRSKDLKDRIHKCLSCGLVMDRDHNAAINVLTLGLEQSNAENLPLLVQPKRKRISKFGTMKLEAHELIHGLFTKRISSTLSP